MNVTRCEFDAYSELGFAEISEIGPSWLDFSHENGDTSYICPPLDTPQGLRRGSVFPGACGQAWEESHAIFIAQSRWIKVACVFPVSPTYNKRGIKGQPREGAMDED